MRVVPENDLARMQRMRLIVVGFREILLRGWVGERASSAECGRFFSGDASGRVT